MYIGNIVLNSTGECILLVCYKSKEGTTYVLPGAPLKQTTLSPREQAIQEVLSKLKCSRDQLVFGRQSDALQGDEWMCFLSRLTSPTERSVEKPERRYNSTGVAYWRSLVWFQKKEPHLLSMLTDHHLEMIQEFLCLEEQLRRHGKK